MKWENKGKEFEGVAKALLEPNTKYMLWGAGKTGMDFLRKFKDEISIIGFIDSSLEKIGKKIDSYEVFSVEKLKDKADFKLIITIHEFRFDDEINSILKKYKLKENYDFVYYNTFIYLYNMYFKNELVVSYIRVPVTEICTLKCRDCVSRITEFKNPIEYSIKSIKDDIDAIFRHVDFVDNFRFVGGEPFLHKNLSELVEYVYQVYGKRINNLVIVSNGTIVPKIEFFEIMNNYGVTLRISNYKNSNEIKKKQRIEEITKIKSNYNSIKLEIAIDDGVWHKYSVNNNTAIFDEDIVEFYDKCICSPVIVRDKKLYNCAWHAAAYLLKEIQDENDDYYDLSEVKDEKSKYVLMEYLLKFSKKGYISGCKSCFGDKPIHQRYIEAAIQKK